jgi:hypothetical protein
MMALTRHADALNRIVFEQLPRGVRDKVMVTFARDAYFITIKASFHIEGKKQPLVTTLIDGDCEGMTIPCIISDEFLARLCVEVS